MFKSLRPLVFLVALLASPLQALALDADNPFGATTSPVVTLVSGGEGELTVQFGILDHNWFLYRDMSSVELSTEGSPLTVGSGVFPKGEVKFDKVSEREREIYADPFTVQVPIQAGDAADGTYDIVLTARWQGCNKPENYCLFPKSVDLPVRVHVGATKGKAETATEEPPEPGEPDASVASDTAQDAATGEARAVSFEGPAASENCAGTAGTKGAGATGLIDRALALLKDSGSSAEGESQGPAFVFLLLVFLGGIASSFTPCVYPMIPITVSVIGANADQGRMKAFVLSCVYVGGIATTYTVLGLAASKTGGVFGAALQNPWVLIGVAAMMAALAAAMMGLYEFALPSGLTTRASTIGGGGGFVGAFVVGTVAGVVAAPCTGPVVAYLLLEIVNNGWSTIDGAFVMLSYSLGLGMLFLVIGTFAGVLASMPRSGTWMVTVKKIFGVVLLGATAYYLGQALDVWDAGAEGGLSWVEGMKSALWAAVLLIGAWTIVSDKRSPARLLSAALLLLVGGWQLFGPQEEIPAVQWDSDHDATLVAATQSGKPTIVDFTADWCAACKELEHYTYTDAAVIQCSEDFERIMFDATATTDEFTALQERYGIKGLPAVFFVCPDGEVLDDLTLKGFEAADRFLQKMNAALRSCEQG
jgi:thiol:disulfide interchange protein DsbD